MEFRTALSTILDIRDRAQRLLGRVGLQVGGADVANANPIPVAPQGTTQIAGSISVSSLPAGLAQENGGVLQASLVGDVSGNLRALEEPGNFGAFFQAQLDAPVVSRLASTAYVDPPTTVAIGPGGIVASSFAAADAIPATAILIAVAVLARAVGSNPAGSLGASLDYVRKWTTKNKKKIIGQNLVVYEDDGVTLLDIIPLTDIDGNPIVLDDNEPAQSG